MLVSNFYCQDYILYVVQHLYNTYFHSSTLISFQSVKYERFVKDYVEMPKN